MQKTILTLNDLADITVNEDESITIQKDGIEKLQVVEVISEVETKFFVKE